MFNTIYIVIKNHYNVGLLSAETMKYATRGIWKSLEIAQVKDGVRLLLVSLTHERIDLASEGHKKTSLLICSLPLACFYFNVFMEINVEGFLV